MRFRSHPNTVRTQTTTAFALLIYLMRTQAPAHRPLIVLLLLAIAGLGFTACGPRTRYGTNYLGGYGAYPTGSTIYRPGGYQTGVPPVQGALLPGGGGGPPRDTVSYWDGDGVQGSPSIRISLGDQRAYFYKGGQLVGVSLISTGREGYETPDGNFKVIEKSPNHRSNLYGDYVDAAGNVVVKDVDVRTDKRPPGTKFLGASMPNFMRIHGGVGMHAGFLPGFAASHGCIRMPEQMAQVYFANAPLGTPVSVTHTPGIY